MAELTESEIESRLLVKVRRQAADARRRKVLVVVGQTDPELSLALVSVRRALDVLRDVLPLVGNFAPRTLPDSASVAPRVPKVKQVDSPGDAVHLKEIYKQRFAGQFPTARVVHESVGSTCGEAPVGSTCGEAPVGSDY